MASRYGKLPFDDSPRTKVFRAIDDILRNDPNLKRVFSRPGAFKSWQGRPDDAQDFGKDQGPALRITPFADPEEYWYPNQQKGFLTIDFELLVPGFSIDDVDNVFYAIERALVPKANADRLKIEEKLKAAGAMIGQCHFVQPAVDRSPALGESGQFFAMARMRIEVMTT